MAQVRAGAQLSSRWLGLCGRVSVYILQVILVCHAGRGAQAGSPTVTEIQFSASIEDFRWLGRDSKVLLLLTVDNHLHRSTDGGKTWTDISNKLILGENAVVAKLIISPADSRTAFVATKNLGHFVSESAGLTWRSVSRLPGALLNMWFFHSARPRWSLASFWSEGCFNSQAPASARAPCAHMLYVTTDLGKTYSKVSTHVVQFSWGQTGHHDRIYFSHFKNKETHQPRHTHWTNDIDFSLSDDRGRSSRIVVPGGNKFVISHGFILVATVKDMAKQNVALMVSHARSRTSDFKEALFPDKVSVKSCIVLDASEGAVVLHVNHGGGVGHVYISDSEGVRYTLSLPDNVHTYDGCAFEKVMNLKGIFVANTKFSGHIQDLKASLLNAPPEDVDERAPSDLEAFQSFGMEAQADKAMRWRRLAEPAAPARRRLQGNSSSGAVRELAGQSPVRTVISFDLGGVWSYVHPPQYDSNGAKIICPPENCWLHLHDLTEWKDHFIPVYSYDNALGILMATGNVGPELSKDRRVTNTYVSRDGGLTWAEAHKGVYIYEFGNHGGLLIMADWNQAAKEVVYSLDEGQSWSHIDFAKDPVSIENILTEPVALSTTFLLYGRRGGRGLLYHLDFEGVHERPCLDIQHAGAPSSDFEMWTPSDGTGGKCLMGHQLQYTRRKQQARCFAASDLRWPTSQKNCQCSAEDFECEIGFVRAFQSLTCTVEGSAADLPALWRRECDTSGTIDATPYRRIVGDTCEGGWQPPPLQFQCPGSNGSPHRGGSSFFGWLVKAALVAASAAAVLCLPRSEAFKSWYRGMTGGPPHASPPPPAREIRHHGSYVPCSIRGPGADGHSIGVDREMQPVP